MTGSGDAPRASSAAAPVEMFDWVTDLGIKVQSNGFSHDKEFIDIAFLETTECLDVSNIPSDIFVILKAPYSAFPCIPLKGGCGGLFDIDNGEPVITITAEFSQLKHEYIHYILYYTTRDSNKDHSSDFFDECS